jgi:hypothetical protein
MSIRNHFSSVRSGGNYKNKWERGGILSERVPKISLFKAGVITGFTMGEGSFFISIISSKTHKTGYQIRPMFIINLKLDDKKILEEIRNLFNCGQVEVYKDSVKFIVRRLDDLVEIIIPFFDRYPLQNIKESDFQYFKIICYKLINGEGKTFEGIKRIMTIRDVMNGRENRKNVKKLFKDTVNL